MTSAGEQRLQLRKDGYSLGVSTERWEEALKTAVPDEVVKIRHAGIEGSASCRTHVAAIPDRVGCHFHAHGNEDYAVVSGQGELHWGKVTKIATEYSVAWEEPMPVQQGDSFVIPEGYAHQRRC